MQRREVDEETGHNPGVSEGDPSPSEVPVETPKLYTGARIRKLFGSGPARRPKTLRIYQHDLTSQAYQSLRKETYLAIDTETGGLDYRNHALLLVQICTEDGRVYMVRKPTKKSNYLLSLLLGEETSFGASTGPNLIFHHAMFDLRFLQAQLGIFIPSSTNGFSNKIHCTKALMKMVHPKLASGLGSALKRILEVKINKNISHENWDAEELDEKQIAYACNDVLYLHELRDKLVGRLDPMGYLSYIKAMTTISYSSQLQVEGYTDLLVYKKDEYEEVKKNRDWWLSKTGED